MAGHQYWRLLCYSNGFNNVFAQKITMSDGEGGTNLTTLGNTITNNEDPSHKAYNAFVSLGGYWATNTPPNPTCYIGQNFGTSTVVTYITYQCPVVGSTYGPYKFEIQFSDDGSSWTTTDVYDNLTWPSNTPVVGFAVSPDPVGSSLTANSIKSQSTLAKPILRPYTNLTANGLSSQSTLQTPILQNVYTLGASNIVGTSSTSSASVYTGIRIFSKPTSTDNAGSWLTNTGDTNLESTISEEEPDDNDYIRSENYPVNSAARIKLSTFTNIDFKGFIVLHYRLGKVGDGELNQTVRFLQGEDVIYSWEHSGVGSLTTYEQIIDPSLITDFSDIHLEFEAS